MFDSGWFKFFRCSAPSMDRLYNMHYTGYRLYCWGWSKPKITFDIKLEDGCSPSNKTDQLISFRQTFNFKRPKVSLIIFGRFWKFWTFGPSNLDLQQSCFFNQFILATRKGIQSQGNRKFRVRSICISKLQTGDTKWHQCHKWQSLQINQIHCLALAVTSDGNINQLGNGDNWNLGVQDDAE